MKATVVCSALSPTLHFPHSALTRVRCETEKPIGMTVDVFLHETGYAVFMLEIPFLGPEEDVADQFATYIELQFAKEDVRRAILGVAFLGRGQAQEELANNPQVQEFADVHGTPAQRYFNALDALTRVAAHGHRKN
jgi:hypothetical protein